MIYEIIRNRELSAAVRGKGEKVGLHIANCMFGSSPEKSTPVEFFWDYHTWLEEKLCDEVTHKLLLSDGFSPESMELLEICRRCIAGRFWLSN